MTKAGKLGVLLVWPLLVLSVQGFSLSDEPQTSGYRVFSSPLSYREPILKKTVRDYLPGHSIRDFDFIRSQRSPIRPNESLRPEIYYHLRAKHGKRPGSNPSFVSSSRLSKRSVLLPRAEANHSSFQNLPEKIMRFIDGEKLIESQIEETPKKFKKYCGHSTKCGTEKLMNRKTKSKHINKSEDYSNVKILGVEKFNSEEAYNYVLNRYNPMYKINSKNTVMNSRGKPPFTPSDIDNLPAKLENIKKAKLLDISEQSTSSEDQKNEATRSRFQFIPVRVIEKVPRKYLRSFYFDKTGESDNDLKLDSEKINGYIYRATPVEIDLNQDEQKIGDHKINNLKAKSFSSKIKNDAAIENHSNPMMFKTIDLINRVVEEEAKNIKLNSKLEKGQSLMNMLPSKYLRTRKRSANFKRNVKNKIRQQLQKLKHFESLKLKKISSEEDQVDDSAGNDYFDPIYPENNTSMNLPIENNMEKFEDNLLLLQLNEGLGETNNDGTYYSEEFNQKAKDFSSKLPTEFSPTSQFIQPYTQNINEGSTDTKMDTLYDTPTDNNRGSKESFNAFLPSITATNTPKRNYRFNSPSETGYSNPTNTVEVTPIISTAPNSYGNMLNSNHQINPNLFNFMFSNNVPFIFPVGSNSFTNPFISGFTKPHIESSSPQFSNSIEKLSNSKTTNHEKNRREPNKPSTSIYKSLDSPSSSSIYNSPAFSSIYQSPNRPASSSSFYKSPASPSTYKSPNRPASSSIYKSSHRPASSIYKSPSRPASSSIYKSPASSTTYKSPSRPASSTTYKSPSRPASSTTYKSPSRLASSIYKSPASSTTYKSPSRPASSTTYKSPSRPASSATYKSPSRPASPLTYKSPASSTSYKSPSRPASSTTYTSPSRPASPSTYKSPASSTSYKSPSRPASSSSYQSKNKPTSATTYFQNTKSRENKRKGSYNIPTTYRGELKNNKKRTKPYQSPSNTRTVPYTKSPVSYRHSPNKHSGGSSNIRPSSYSTAVPSYNAMAISDITTESTYSYATPSTFRPTPSPEIIYSTPQQSYDSPSIFSTTSKPHSPTYFYTTPKPSGSYQSPVPSPASYGTNKGTSHTTIPILVRNPNLQPTKPTSSYRRRPSTSYGHNNNQRPNSVVMNSGSPSSTYENPRQTVSFDTSSYSTTGSSDNTGSFHGTNYENSVKNRPQSNMPSVQNYKNEYKFPFNPLFGLLPHNAVTPIPTIHHSTTVSYSYNQPANNINTFGTPNVVPNLNSFNLAYGVPNVSPNQNPVTYYGLPNVTSNQNPVSSYGVPNTTPSQNPMSFYGIPNVTPNQNPATSYGVPTQNPVTSYGVPTVAPNQNTINSLLYPNLISNSLIPNVRVMNPQVLQNYQLWLAMMTRAGINPYLVMNNPQLYSRLIYPNVNAQSYQYNNVFSPWRGKSLLSNKTQPKIPVTSSRVSILQNTKQQKKENELVNENFVKKENSYKFKMKREFKEKQLHSKPLERNKQYNYKREKEENFDLKKKMISPYLVSLHPEDKSSANYKFHYLVSDSKADLQFGQHEKISDDGARKGEYFVKMADGRTQRVRYTADSRGYRAKVTYSK